ncbi:MAG: hypothetical protein SFT90_06270 [Rickettsiales bacterium]|nr:hypothetical protein [Rickettsiales bacterium]
MFSFFRNKQPNGIPVDIDVFQQALLKAGINVDNEFVMVLYKNLDSFFKNRSDDEYIMRKFNYELFKHFNNNPNAIKKYFIYFAKPNEDYDAITIKPSEIHFSWSQNLAHQDKKAINKIINGFHYDAFSNKEMDFSNFENEFKNRLLEYYLDEYENRPLRFLPEKKSLILPVFLKPVAVDYSIGPDNHIEIKLICERETELSDKQKEIYKNYILQPNLVYTKDLMKAPISEVRPKAILTGINLRPCVKTEPQNSK